MAVGLIPRLAIRYVAKGIITHSVSTISKQATSQAVGGVGCFGQISPSELDMITGKVREKLLWTGLVVIILGVISGAILYGGILPASSGSFEMCLLAVILMILMWVFFISGFMILTTAASKKGVKSMVVDELKSKYNIGVPDAVVRPVMYTPPGQPGMYTGPQPYIMGTSPPQHQPAYQGGQQAPAPSTGPPPAQTSLPAQTKVRCWQCGFIISLPQWERSFRCPRCGTEGEV
ncbi:MAG: hypothetical protein JSW28_02665 [Thermoplasmata archaeon]|nr:MAG: hypothetical protein JSW28_02665 [Thermoplasmata archaeon]